MFKKFIELLTQNFEKRISVKTGWGKNEIIDQFRLAMIESFSDIEDSNKLLPHESGQNNEWNVHKEPNLPHL